MRILVVEDEPALADVVRRRLEREGMAVDVASDGRTALRRALVTAYDAIVLDRDLPRVHGDAVCRELADRSPRPRILMLTAAGEVSDRVEGLSLGADDYLPKPFALLELVARLRALGRRDHHARPPVLRFGDIELDPSKRMALRAGEELVLGRREFGVLETLLAADGDVVTTEELLRRVWDENIDPFSSIVRMTMMTLRRKLGEPEVIRTVTGIGYKLGLASIHRSAG